MSFAAEVKQQLCRSEVKSPSAAVYELIGLSSGKIDYPERRLFLEKKAGGSLTQVCLPEILEDNIEGEDARGFIRGCFVACGSVNIPKKTPI